MPGIISGSAEANEKPESSVSRSRLASVSEQRNGLLRLTSGLLALGSHIFLAFQLANPASSSMICRSTLSNRLPNNMRYPNNERDHNNADKGQGDVPPLEGIHIVAPLLLPDRTTKPVGDDSRPIAPVSSRAGPLCATPLVLARPIFAS